MNNLEQQQIEVARYWAGVEEMKDCPWMLVVGTPVPEEWRLIDDTRETFTRIIPVADAEALRILKEDFKDAAGWEYEILPYLKIEDGSIWSSAAILARSGIPPQKVVQALRNLAKEKGLGYINHAPAFVVMEAWIEEEGQLELGFNLALQWLHKNAHDVWLKGMEALK